MNQNQNNNWGQMSTITQDTMSDISKLALGTISQINNSVREVDEQSPQVADGPDAQQENNENIAQINKLKISQQLKQQFNKKPVNNFQQNYRLIQQTMDQSKKIKMMQSGQILQ